MSKDLNASLCSELRVDPWVWKIALCLGRNMCWGLSSALPRQREFLLWMSNVFVSSSVSRRSAGVWLWGGAAFPWPCLGRQQPLPACGRNDPRENFELGSALRQLGYTSFPSVMTISRMDTLVASQLQPWEHPNGSGSGWDEDTPL